MVKVQVIQADALTHLINFNTSPNHKAGFCAAPNIPAIFTSMPDAEEMGIDIHEWKPWFRGAAETMINVTAPKGYTFFYQTDRRHDGVLISKATMIMDAAIRQGKNVIMHKICQTTKGVNFFRPGYTHLIGI